MARKNIEGIYDRLFKLQSDLQDVLDSAADITTDIKNYGGEISRVVTEQLGKYFIPAIKSLISDEATPGSISGIVTFLDSVPLALTRQDPVVDLSEPSDVDANLNLPTGTDVAQQGIQQNVVSETDTLPNNASYAQQIQESTIYKVVRVSDAGGDIKPFGERDVNDFCSEEEAIRNAEILNSTLTPMEKDLWNVRYEVRKIERELEDGTFKMGRPKKIKVEVE